MDLPAVVTFDIFGTVIDWRSGLEQACSAHGRPLRDGELERIIDVQAELEGRAEFDLYTSIAIKSLASVLGLDGTSAATIAGAAGNWPLFADSRDGLRRIQARVRCVATTNSDKLHAAQVQRQLGFPLSAWICSEEVKHYKPRREIWDTASEQLGVAVGPHWWHVSAYADYDLKTARKLGLTTVFVDRPHARPGPADLTVPDLAELARTIEAIR